MSLDRNASARSIRAMGGSIRQVEDRALRSIDEARRGAARVVLRVSTELVRREAELDCAREDLRSCLLQEDTSCLTEYARVRRADTAVAVASQCLASAKQTRDDMSASVGDHGGRLAQAATQARQFLGARLQELGDYTALGGSGTFGSTSRALASTSTSGAGSSAATLGGALAQPAGLPQGFFMVPVAMIDLSSSTVRGVSDFKKGYSPEDLAWAFQAFEQVVLPGLASGANADTFHARDKVAGYQGTHSYSMTHSQFLSMGDCIRLNPQPDGTYAIANGQHRVWVAQKYGIARVPARIV